MKSLTHILTIFLILSLSVHAAFSQGKIPVKTTSTSLKDSVSVKGNPDSVKMTRDSTLINKDSTKNNGGLQAEVSIIARDSQRTEVDKNISHLYKGAKVKYQDLNYLQIISDSTEIKNRYLLQVF